MFWTIFKYEIQHWLRQPAVYIYAAIFLLVPIGGMASDAGIFTGHDGTSTSIFMANSPKKIMRIFFILNRLLLILIPAVIGLSIYRDFRTNMHTVFYSYPITKPAYLGAKFLSAITVMSTIVALTGLGIFIGTQVPGVNKSMLLPFDLMAYLQPFFVYMLPNILLFGAMVFSVVLLTRNIYAGFITVVVLLFVQGLIGALLQNESQFFIASVFDPFGQFASGYATRYWTAEEVNAQLLPLSKSVIYNRLLWLGVAATIITLVYRKFSFEQNAVSFGFKKAAKASFNKAHFGKIIQVNLPKVAFDFSIKEQLKTMWHLSNMEFRYIVSSWLFRAIFIAGFLFVVSKQMNIAPMFGYKMLPATWQMLSLPTALFSGIITFLTYLFAGMLVHRSRVANIHQLVDSTPVSNWSLMGSKFIALLKMQLVLLTFLMVGGIIAQAVNGYYKFEIGHYLFELYVLQFSGMVLWAFVAIFIQTLLNNAFLGTFLLVGGMMFLAGLPEFGIEQEVFRYGAGIDLNYSDLDGYGSDLAPHFLYKFYWSLFGLFMLFGTYAWWRRGMTPTFLQRFKLAVGNVKGKVALGMFACLFSFFALGFGIYYEDNIAHDYVSDEDEDLWRANFEKQYKRYENTVQPRITGINIHMDLYPKTRDFVANGTYILTNKSEQIIDTLLINYPYLEITNYNFPSQVQLVKKDSNSLFDIWHIEGGLAIGDSIEMQFQTRNEPNTFFRNNSQIKGNASFTINNMFPGLGYRAAGELRDNAARKKYGLASRKYSTPLPSDTTALGNSYGSIDSDWLQFEATVSTSTDQIAIAPGYLQKEWTENGRRYFHYKMDSPIKKYYGFNSGRFEVYRDKWNDVDIEVYYQKGVDYNLENLAGGTKGALAYNSEYFTPYQHRQARIMPFPKTINIAATTFANSVPFSETFYLVDTEHSDDALNLPYYVAAHEMAHQWWGNQLSPGAVLGSKMVTESMAEYTALQVMKHEFGEAEAQRFLNINLGKYLRGRSGETDKEYPLIHCKNGQTYIAYGKGAVVLYAMSRRLGEARFNAAIQAYLKQAQYQSQPYTTSLEMLDFIRKATPDSLQYLIRDNFETVTLYDNQIAEANVTELADGKYQLDLEFNISKFRDIGNGKRSYVDSTDMSFLEEMTYLEHENLKSLPLADYIDIGVFDEAGEPLYLQEMKFTTINNQLQIVVDKKPVEVKIDPYLKLIDAKGEDHIRRL